MVKFSRTPCSGKNKAGGRFFEKSTIVLSDIAWPRRRVSVAGLL